MRKLICRKLDTTIGTITLIGDGEVIEYIAFPDTSLPKQYSGKLTERKSAYRQAARELKQYFQRRRTTFSFPVRIKANGFQARALEALATVDYGQAISYKELAEMAGSPTAYRAAGSACAMNPLPIVIPCHRVLKSDGSLGGFGGGLKTKKQLLDLEQVPYKLG